MTSLPAHTWPLGDGEVKKLHDDAAKPHRARERERALCPDQPQCSLSRSLSLSLSLCLLHCPFLAIQLHLQRRTRPSREVLLTRASPARVLSHMQLYGPSDYVELGPLDSMLYSTDSY
eukprot:1523829-Amphidinium_carterae.1